MKVISLRYICFHLFRKQKNGTKDGNELHNIQKIISNNSPNTNSSNPFYPGVRAKEEIFSTNFSMETIIIIQLHWKKCFVAERISWYLLATLYCHSNLRYIHVVSF